MSQPTAINMPPRDMLERAAAALDAALDDNWDAVDDTLRAAQRAKPGAGVPVLVIIWCDFYLTHATAGNPKQAAALAALATIAADTPDPHQQWAGRLIRARADLNAPGYFAVLDELGDPVNLRELVPHLHALLRLLADATRRPYGWALPGAAP